MTMSQRNIRWGLIGYGDLARKRVAAALQQAAHSELVCVYGRDHERAVAFAADFNIRQGCRTRDEFLALDLDAVYICTPPESHAEYALEALAAGRHVLVEKPMAKSASEANAMIEAAQRRGLRLGVAYYRRAFPKMQKIKALLASGALGTIVHVDVVCRSWYAPALDDPKRWRVDKSRSAGAGALADVGVHRLDLLDDWFGPLRPVAAAFQRLAHDYSVEDGASALLELPSGAPVHVFCAWNTRAWSDRIEVTGSEARLIADPLDSASLVVVRGNEREEIGIEPPVNAHLPCVQDFVDAVLSDRPPLCSGSAGSRTTLLLDSLIASAEANVVPSVIVRQPANDFAEFNRTYFEKCVERSPLIEASAGKWAPEDLIPGLSDFDTRFILSDATRTEDWCGISMNVAKVHLELLKARPDWARNLEHLPGVNLRWSELLDRRIFFPEARQWTFYHGCAERLSGIRRQISEMPWSSADEAFHWKKIAAYYGRYDRRNDPPINLGPYLSKYPLHSRIMHYLAPPLHSAVCLMQRRAQPGKIEAFRIATELFPNPQTVRRMLSLVESHYDGGTLDLTGFDDDLEEYLKGVVNTLLKNSALECHGQATSAELNAAVARTFEAASTAQIHESLRFARLMKGRLWFYTQSVPWFDSGPLLQNEFNRLRASFVTAPVTACARMATGDDLPFSKALEFLGCILNKEQLNAMRHFAELADPTCPKCELKNQAPKLIEVFDAFLDAAESILRHATNEEESRCID
jgi:predicted dehydrogenase